MHVNLRQWFSDQINMYGAVVVSVPFPEKKATIDMMMVKTPLAVISLSRSHFVVAPNLSTCSSSSFTLLKVLKILISHKFYQRSEEWQRRLHPMCFLRALVASIVISTDETVSYLSDHFFGYGSIHWGVCNEGHHHWWWCPPGNHRTNWQWPLFWWLYDRENHKWGALQYQVMFETREDPYYEEESICYLSRERSPFLCRKEEVSAFFQWDMCTPSLCLPTLQFCPTISWLILVHLYKYLSNTPHIFVHLSIKFVHHQHEIVHLFI